MSKAPVLFISHGAPTFALEPGRLGDALRDFGKNHSAIKVVLVISPHWMTRDMQVMSTSQPETLHDFGGFPRALYELHYPAAGSSVLAQQAQALLTQAGFSVELNAQRGLDHGAWVPLRHLYPDAGLPVFQVSMPYDLDAGQAFAMGKALAPLRMQGVMILASGSLTHNLHELRSPEAPVADYVATFTAWARDALQRHDVDGLIDYRRRAPEAVRAHPTDEHFLPLLIALGASMAEEQLHVLPSDYRYGVLSMESYYWGAE